ncbi:MAG: hypothetical protein ACQERF_08680 [Actinomycetota bacterium]
MLGNSGLNPALRFADGLIRLSEVRVDASGGREVVTPTAVSKVYGVTETMVSACDQQVVVPR